MRGAIDEDGSYRPFDPATDFPGLAKAARQIADLGLIIIDPVVSIVAGDSHKNTEVRRGLQPLVDLAGELKIAVLGITHFTKGTAGRDPIERVTGSLAFGALPRLVMATAKPKEKGEPWRVVRAKSNIGPDGGGFEYELDQVQVKGGVYGQKVSWGEPLEGAARELLAEVESDGEADAPALDDAVRWLEGLLADGPFSAAEIRRLAEVADRSIATVKRAKKKLGIIARKTGFHGGWEWSLPKDVTEGVHTETVIPFGSSLKNPKGNADKCQDSPMISLEGYQAGCVDPLDAPLGEDDNVEVEI